MRSVDAGYFTNAAASRIGRRSRLPPQLGHWPLSTLSVQSAQNVHSKLQMRASALPGGKSRSQVSQFGLSCSINWLR
jgi:hypothetical protein